ncbi:MAG: hypothetical protein WBX38_18080 [Candidatus Sulfotelmatobacter sp.]
MSPTQTIRHCTHIKVNGIRCGSPALREEAFCYFHQRMIRGVRTPPKSRIHPIAMLENKESIQASLMEIINALVRNHIDVNRARLILRALYIASRNCRLVHFEPYAPNIVTEVPEYAEAPPTGPFALVTLQAAALARIGTSPHEDEEEESESDRISRHLAEMAKPPQPKPPARSKNSASPRRRIPVAKEEAGSLSRLFQLGRTLPQEAEGSGPI